MTGSSVACGRRPAVSFGLVEESRDLRARAEVQLGDRAALVRERRHRDPPALVRPGRACASTGTRTSVKKISLNSFSPVIVTSGRTSTPGNVMSTSRHVMPLCFGTDRVGAHEQLAPVRDVAERVPRLLTVDDPAVAVAHRRTCAATRGRSRRSARRSPGTRCRRRAACGGGASRFCSSVPCSMIAGAMFERPSGLSVPGACARCISSAYTTCSITPGAAPAPFLGPRDRGVTGVGERAVPRAQPFERVAARSPVEPPRPSPP